MNKFGIIGVGLAALSMGGGMWLTGSASASSINDVGTVQVDTDRAAGPTEPCVRFDSAVAEVPEGGIEISVDDVGEPIESFEMAPDSSWHSVSIDADGNITTDQGTDDDLPTALDPSLDNSAGGATGTFSSTAAESGAIPIPEADIHLGVPCQP